MWRNSENVLETVLTVIANESSKVKLEAMIWAKFSASEERNWISVPS